MEIRLTTHRTRTTDLNGIITAASDLYLVSGSDGAGDDEILQSVLDAAPESCGTAYLEGARITGEEGAGVVKVEVMYRSAGDAFSNYRYQRVKRSGDRVWSFDVECHHEEITHGIRLIQSVSNGGGLSPGTVINWNGQSGPQGKIGGVKRLAPAMTEECIATFKADDITTAYKRTLLKLTGSVNDDTFHGWEKGEVLFTGATQSKSYQNDRKEWLTDVVFHFAIRPNSVAPYLGTLRLKGVVEGWDYPWLIEESCIGSGGSGAAPVRRTRGAFLTRIYPRANFRLLALGSSNEDDIHIRLVRRGR